MENEFTTWLMDELKNRDWTQSDLAQRSGISQGAISKVLLGQRNPGLDFCKGVSKAFRIPVETVLALTGNMPPRNENLQEIEELNFLFNLLSEDKKEMLIGFARYLSERND